MHVTLSLHDLWLLHAELLVLVGRLEIFANTVIYKLTFRFSGLIHISTNNACFQGKMQSKTKLINDTDCIHAQRIVRICGVV